MKQRGGVRVLWKRLLVENDKNSEKKTVSHQPSNTYKNTFYRACKLFNIPLYATLCFNYFRWHRRIFSYGSVLELL